MKPFFNETLNVSPQKVLGLLSFGFCQNCMNSSVIWFKLYGSSVLKDASFKSLSRISATTFGEFIQFGQNPKLRRPRTFWVEKFTVSLKKDFIFQVHLYLFASSAFYFQVSYIYIYMYVCISSRKKEITKIT